MITPTINGWNRVSMPTDPVAPMQIDWQFEDNVAVSTSPFTWQAQMQQWFGADRLSGQFSMPPMTPQQARGWRVFLAELSGTLNCFRMGDPKYAHPQGVPGASVPLVDGVAAAAATNPGNLPGQRVLYTKGWTPNGFHLLVPGDLLQIGERLHHVTGAGVQADANGKCQVSIYPGIREAPADGDPVIIKNCTGLFRLKKNARGWHNGIPLTTIGIDFEEML